MWTWIIREGELLDPKGKPCAVGYSGWDDGDGVLEPGEGKNDPDACAIRNVGPIPPGRYRIVGPPVDTETHGPYVLRLLPQPGTETFGRSGFLIHGDSNRKPGTASHGCIILPHWARCAIWVSGDRALLVVADPPPIVREVA